MLLVSAARSRCKNFPVFSDMLNSGTQKSLPYISVSFLVKFIIPLITFCSQ